MTFTEQLRKDKEEELTAILTEMLEESRTTLIDQISAELSGISNEYTIKETTDIINSDIDSKLKLIPETVNALLNDADGRAQRAFDKQYGKSFFGELTA